MRKRNTNWIVIAFVGFLALASLSLKGRIGYVAFVSLLLFGLVMYYTDSKRRKT